MGTEIDWSALRERSLQPGGFGFGRVDLWPKLLHAIVPLEADSLDLSREPNTDSHRDERQIGLDTDRSFVLYPVESVEGQDRGLLQRALQALLLDLFRKRPTLSYFQGYHDIVTVLFLTLPEELQLPCAEQMSLHRLRDAMGKGLEPIVGQLYILKNLLRLADPEYAILLEQTTPIPYFALSNLLTLFSHDVPTLPLIQHVFDYLLCRPPIASIYLAASIILSRKGEALRLQEEGEEGMLHSLLSQLPDLYEEGTDEERRSKSQTRSRTPLKDQEVEAGILSESLDESAPPSNETSSSLPALDADVPSAAPPAIAPYEITPSNEPSHDDLELNEKVPFLASARETPSPTPPEPSLVGHVEKGPPLVAELNNVPIFVPPPSDPSPPPSRSRSPSPTRSQRPRIPLSTLLKQADDLLARFPPPTPALALDRVFAANSVMHTWHEDPSLLPNDNDAEAMVEHPELIVLPYVEVLEEEKEQAELEQKEKEREGRRRRRLRKRRRVVIERGVVLATAVVVVGVAMAVYGGRAGGVKTDRHDWRRMSRWLGGAMIGVGERLWDGLRAL